MSKSLRNGYADNVNEFEKLVDEENRILLRISTIRLIAFFAGLFGVIFCFTKNIWLGVASLFLFVILFSLLVRIFGKHTEKKEHYDRLAQINQNELLALDGDFSMFDDGNVFSDPSHDFTYDIDIFGKGSLFQYLNRTVTAYGRFLLAKWMASPFEMSGMMKERAEAISELSDKFEWRQNFMSAGMVKQLSKEEMDSLLEWLSVHNDTMLSKSYNFLKWILPIVTNVVLVLLCCGFVHYMVFVMFLIINTMIVYLYSKKTNEIYERLSGMFQQLNSLSAQMQLFENEKFESSLLNDLKENNSQEKQSGVEALFELGKIVKMFDNRNNLIINFVYNGLGLYDLHCIHQLEKWQKRYKINIRHWIEAIGEVDALSSLANYCYNHKDFVFPKISDGDKFFDVKNMGHPLIDAKRRVCNDFCIDERKKICIITGANMAGKSTFLRTIAVNYILAMIGAPVCAESMEYVPIRLFTSMRTTDSLNSGESYFYAELKRLKLLTDKLENDDNTFFILDEILKGTNSDDKRLGSTMFLKKVIDLGGTGVIATHDTSLGDMEEEYPDVIFNMSREVEVNGDEIKFDYLLKPGIAKNKN
ncbi:MAG: hypothetical protein J6X92_06045, partial [Bacteroidales bacterium]|nr:hypothetical protein [Bacteroidales bacterium]